MTRIEQARRAYGRHGGGVPPFNTYHRIYDKTRPLYRWASEFWWIREACEVAASLVLDGLSAKWRR